MEAMEIFIHVLNLILVLALAGGVIAIITLSIRLLRKKLQEKK